MVSANGTDQLLAGDVAKLIGVGVQTLHFYVTRPPAESRGRPGIHRHVDVLPA